MVAPRAPQFHYSFAVAYPLLASASAASLPPRTPVCERTCSMLTVTPLSCCSRRYASRSRNASSLLAAFGPLRGLVLPVAMCTAYTVLSVHSEDRDAYFSFSPCTARRSPVISAALLLCVGAPWYILWARAVTTFPYRARSKLSRPDASILLCLLFLCHVCFVQE